MNNNIILIDQRLAQLRRLISRFRIHSTASKTRLPYEIITYQLKRINAIHARDKKLGELRGLIPVYKARCPAYKPFLADYIINLEHKLISLKSSQFLPKQSLSHPPVTHPPTPQPIQSNYIAGFFTKHPRQIPNFYWQKNQPVAAPVKTFSQIEYLFLPIAVPGFDQAVSRARLDCGRDLH